MTLRARGRERDPGFPQAAFCLLRSGLRDFKAGGIITVESLKFHFSIFRMIVHTVYRREFDYPNKARYIVELPSSSACSSA